MIGGLGLGLLHGVSLFGRCVKESARQLLPLPPGTGLILELAVVSKGDTVHLFHYELTDRRSWA